jgi:PhzF family phenazine biosynthesis protein
MQLQIHHIDAFTQSVFSGNYAAVIVLEQWLADDVMQSIASENNLSETAFVVNSTENIYDIRWFSPIAEIDFCGHATLASSFVLFKQYPGLEHIIFQAPAVGRLTLTVAEDGLITMRAPNRCPQLVEKIPQILLDSLGCKPIKVLRNQQAYFAIFNTAQEVEQLTPNFDGLRQLAPFDIAVSALSDQDDYDFVARYFWPANGGDEDPVTGSMYAGLAPYWATETGKHSMKAYQASQRGGIVYCQVEDDTVAISGYAVQYMQGVITV